MANFRASVLLSLQRAMWDLVTPGLRGVAVKVSESQIQARCIFEAAPNEADIEDVSLMGTCVVADFPDDVLVEFASDFVVPDKPRLLLPGEEWVYLRKESNDFNY